MTGIVRLATAYLRSFQPLGPISFRVEQRDVVSRVTVSRHWHESLLVEA